MTTNLDRDLLNASADARGAIGDASALTDSARLQAALQVLVNRAEAADSVHAEAVRTHQADGRANRTASSALHRAVERAIGLYSYLQSSARPRLVDVDPDLLDELGPDEVSARAAWFDDTFGTAPSDLQRQGRVAVGVHLRQVVERIAARPDYVAQEDHDRLAAAVTAIEQAHQAQRAEQLDDADLAERLEQARKDTRRQTRALLLVAEGILASEGSAITLDRLLQQASGRRRAASSPSDAPSDVVSPAPTPSDAPSQPAEPEAV